MEDRKPVALAILDLLSSAVKGLTFPGFSALSPAIALSRVMTSGESRSLGGGAR